ncbi:MAG: hypothetical protein COB04_15890, partial [Gammaproteobacteria bacterium]
MPNVESSKEPIIPAGSDSPDFSAADFVDQAAKSDDSDVKQVDAKVEPTKEPSEPVLLHHARGFVSFKNIKDKTGKTVVKKGAKLTHKMTEVLAKKETSVVAKTFKEAKELISSKQVIQDISQFVDGCADLKIIEKNIQCHAVINDLGYSVNLPPEIKYYLTIMKICI